jgi:hypothetical protein
MSKSTKAVAEIIESNTEVNPSAVMQVVKAEPQSTEVVKPANVHDVLARLKEQWHLSQEHASLNAQLDKLKVFKSGISEETTLILRNGTYNQFQSSDAHAVDALIDICMGNIIRKVEKIEGQLLNF